MFDKSKIVILSLITMLVLTSCGYMEQVFTRPRPWGMADTPEGSPTFQQGWEDGCDSGLGVYGSYHYRVKAYRFRQDYTQINNPEYYRAWKDGYGYCRWYVWNWSRPQNK